MREITRAWLLSYALAKGQVTVNKCILVLTLKLSVRRLQFDVSSRSVRRADSMPNNNLDKYFLASIVETSHDSIITINLDMEITSWNRAAESLYG